MPLNKGTLVNHMLGLAKNTLLFIISHPYIFQYLPLSLYQIIPTLGMKCSHLGNKTVPRMGTKRRMDGRGDVRWLCRGLRLVITVPAMVCFLILSNSDNLFWIILWKSYADRKCIVAIDEFQAIADYPERNVEELMRTYVQQCRNAVFVFSGSQKSMMSEMFSSPARPFYQSVSMMFLKPVPLPEYEVFAKKHFEKAGKQIDDGVVRTIYEHFDGTTWYLQKVLNQLFATQDHVCVDDVDTAVIQIINQNEEAYKDVLYQLTARQRDLLVAVGHEGKARQITGAPFVKRYHLTSASSVQKSSQALIEKQLLTHQQGVYEIYDKFMAEWIRSQ